MCGVVVGNIVNYSSAQYVGENLIQLIEAKQNHAFIKVWLSSRQNKHVTHCYINVAWYFFTTVDHSSHRIHVGTLNRLCGKYTK